MSCLQGLLEEIQLQLNYLAKFSILPAKSSETQKRVKCTNLQEFTCFFYIMDNFQIKSGLGQRPGSSPASAPSSLLWTLNEACACNKQSWNLSPKLLANADMPEVKRVIFCFEICVFSKNLSLWNQADRLRGGGVRVLFFFPMRSLPIPCHQ